MNTYRTSASGRRVILTLLVGALVIWAFALWSFQNTLGVSYNPLTFWGSLSAAIAQGLGIGQIVPALLMLVLIVATPLLVWNLLEEWAATYTLTETGLRFQSLGVELQIPWTAIQHVRRVEDDGDETLHEIVLTAEVSRQIKNPLVRWLHTQGFGRQRLPIYAGIEQRDELVSAIQQRVG